MSEWQVEELWRFGGLVRRRRTHKSGFIQEMLSWRGYALTWTGEDRLRFVGEVRDRRYAKWIILAGLAVVVAVVILGKG